jgi:MFS family permease
MVQNLKFTASMVGITSIVTTVTSLLVQRRVGKLADRLGSRQVMLISMVLIPLLPAAWVLVSKLWHVVALNLFGGVVWGAFNLVSFNFLLSLTPTAQRARYSAIYQILITLSLALGAAVGALIVTKWGFQAVFACSAIGRYVAVFLFARYIPKMALQTEYALSA